MSVIFPGSFFKWRAFCRNVAGAVGLADRLCAMRVVSSDGLAPAQRDPAGDGGLCAEPDLTPSGLGDGGRMGVE